ncbi:TRAP dicarboxylate transporter, DctP subunit [uncultured delta proteobacterium]|uniref:TRAP dicarboxylate transporter, DctP subunit n=1 Tax=uncultured delta proteobacterium TaxID=34034 RepID=A0A212KE35_9DELT|nr:TRAP dicarboxylate transporter, DctP subunit [uncultured delta proteobacterium]
MKKAVSILLTMAMVISLSCGVANAAAFTLKIGSTVQDDSASGISLLKYFKPYIEEKSGGKIAVEVYNNSVLGGDRQLFESLQMNTVQGSFGPMSVLASFAPDFSVCDAPFLFKDRKTAYAALDGEFGALMAKTLPQKGMRLLGYGENAFRNISNTVRPVEKLEDMKGLKIRVMESPVYINTIKALGGNATPIAFNELYTALQQGTVDGQDNGVVLTYTTKIYEILKYYTFSEHCYAANAYVFSEEFLQTLPPDLLKVVQDGTNYALVNQRRLNAEMEQTLIKEIEKSGVKVSYLSAEEKERWRKATANVIDGLAGTVSKEVLEAAKNVNAKYGN